MMKQWLMIKGKDYRQREFIASVEIDENGVVVETAPILKYMKGWKFIYLYETPRNS